MATKQTNRIESGIQPNALPYVRFTLQERESLRQLAKSRDVKDRRRCIDYLRLGTYHRQNYKFMIEMCDELIPDRSHYVRWQSLLLLGYFVESYPELIWSEVLKLACVKNKDIRIGTACCVLEHILQHHFTEYFSKIEALIEGGNKLLADTLSYCYKLGETEKSANAKKFDELIEKYGKKVPGVN